MVSQRTKSRWRSRRGEHQRGGVPAANQEALLKIRRKIKIASTVTREVRMSGGPVAFCPMCRRVADPVGRTEAVRLVGATALDGWLASGEVHRVEAPGAGAMICRDSLIRAKERMES